MNGDQQPQTPGGPGPVVQPQPGNSPPSLTEPSQPLPSPPARPIAATQPKTTIMPPRPAAPAVAPQEAQQRAQAGPDGGFFRTAEPAIANAGAESGLAARAANPDEPVSWVSSGEALQARSSSWRLRMTIVSIVAGALIFLITRDLVSTIAVAFAGIAFGFLGARKPPALEYHLDYTGITIGQKHYRYSEFRAFSVAEYPSPSANLIPLKRFLPVLSIHLDAAQYDSIVSVLSNHLPMEQHRSDVMDKIISRARF